MTELHVIPDERTTWRVYEAGATAPLSEHTNATDAELAALARAHARDTERVVVHDRYHRTHDAAPSQAERRPRTRRARPPARPRARTRPPARPQPARAVTRYPVQRGGSMAAARWRSTRPVPHNRNHRRRHGARRCGQATPRRDQPADRHAPAARSPAAPPDPPHELQVDTRTPVTGHRRLHHPGRPWPTTTT